LDKLPIKARPLSPLGRVGRWAARRPLQAVVAALVLFLAIAGPATALVIRRQSVRLSELVGEQGYLIKKREQENREAIARSARLQERLDVWEGRANPWSMWPPDPDQSPKRRQLASLLGARGDDLQELSDAESNLVEAQSLLALAILYDSSSRYDEAERCLLRALTSLQDLRDARPRSTAIGLSLADCYDQLSALAAPRDQRESNRWLAEAVALRRTLAAERPGDPLFQAYRLDAELRFGAAAGFEQAQEQLTEAERLDDQLERAWPESPSAIYRLACLLAGRSPWLAEEPADGGGATKASDD
jgi:tetratricopeptide (TPR) repeat protein